MQTIALKPQRAQIMTGVAALVLLTAAMALFPPACLPLALIAPLAACPLAGRKQQWAAWLSAVAPAAVSLLNGFDALYSLSLALPGAAAMAMALWLRARKTLGAPVAIAWMIAAYAAALAAVAAAGSRALGGSLSVGLARLLTDGVKQSDRAGLLLYRFAASGLISVPRAYRQADLLAFAFDPVLIRQMLMSFRLSAENLLFSALPSLFVQASVLGGLFSALRTQRLNCAIVVVAPDAEKPGERKARVTSPPGFRFIAPSKAVRRTAAAMGLAALIFVSMPQTLMQTLGLLCYEAFCCVFQVTGAAVLVCMLSARQPDRATAGGVAAAVLYVLFPLALLILGVSDQAFHYRARVLKPSDQKKEE